MDDNTLIQLNRGELKSLLEEAVNNAFTKMGMDVGHPIEMQRDFQHLRDWRLAVVAVRTKGFLTIVGLLAAGLVAAVWIGVKAIIAAS